MAPSPRLLVPLKVLGAALQSGPRATWVTIGAKRRRAKQKSSEFARLCQVVEKAKPRVVLEIGTMHGGTLWAWCRLATDDALIISVDLPGGGFGGGYDPRHARTLRSYAGCGQRLELIAGDSHSPKTLRQVQQILGERAIDLLFIDGDHTYEGVSQDFAMYGPLVRPSGLIAFHDVLPCRPEDGQVSRFWEETKWTYRFAEMLDETEVSWRGPWGGIGVLFVDRHSPTSRSIDP
jgi:predicted O-methyltransferase YrrM